MKEIILSPSQIMSATPSKTGKTATLIIEDNCFQMPLNLPSLAADGKLTKGISFSPSTPKGTMMPNGEPSPFNQYKQTNCVLIQQEIAELNLLNAKLGMVNNVGQMGADIKPLMEKAMSSIASLF